MKIIKSAFDEGRNTTVKWSESKTKSKLDIEKLTIHNSEVLNSESDFGKSKKIQQIDVNTGKVINTFANQSQAGKWIVQNIMTPKGQNTRSKFYQIMGNLRISMLLGYKSYGFYWKILNSSSRVRVTINPIDVDYIQKSQSIPKGKIKKTLYLKTKSGQRAKCSSVSELSKLSNLSKETVSRRIHDFGRNVNLNGIKYVRVTKKPCPVNVVEEYKLRLIDSSGEIYGLYKSVNDVAKALNVTTSSVYKSRKHNTSVKGMLVQDI